MSDLALDPPMDEIAVLKQHVLTLQIQHAKLKAELCVLRDSITAALALSHTPSAGHAPVATGGNP